MDNYEDMIHKYHVVGHWAKLLCNQNTNIQKLCEILMFDIDEIESIILKCDMEDLIYFIYDHLKETIRYLDFNRIKKDVCPIKPIISNKYELDDGTIVKLLEFDKEYATLFAEDMEVNNGCIYNCTFDIPIDTFLRKADDYE